MIERNELFAVLPSVSPLSVGHIMLVPNRHVRGVSQLASDERLELIAAASTYASQLRRHSEAVAVFEHGIGADLQGGCGIDHAHVHLVPSTRRNIAEARTQILLDYDEASRYELTSFLDSTPSADSYLWFGGSDGPVTAVRCDSIPSQYLRRTLAELTESAWDWHRLSGWPEFEATLSTMRSDGRFGATTGS
jgi:diadenosine tetraphosphate (Ap4A) HIT family hydrolase